MKIQYLLYYIWCAIPNFPHCTESWVARGVNMSSTMEEVTDWKSMTSRFYLKKGHSNYKRKIVDR